MVQATPPAVLFYFPRLTKLAQDRYANVLAFNLTFFIQELFCVLHRSGMALSSCHTWGRDERLP